MAKERAAKTLSRVPTRKRTIEGTNRDGAEAEGAQRRSVRAWRRVRGGWTQGWLAVSEWQVHFIKTPSAALWPSRVIRRPAADRSYPYPQLFPTQRACVCLCIYIYACVHDTYMSSKKERERERANGGTVHEQRNAGTQGNIYECRVWTDMSPSLMSPFLPARETTLATTNTTKTSIYHDASVPSFFFS